MAEEDQAPQVEKRAHGDMREIGSTGLRRSGGVVIEELFRELEGQRGRLKYKEMGDNDPVISGILYAFEMMFRQARMTVRPGNINHSGKMEDSKFYGKEGASEEFAEPADGVVQKQEDLEEDVDGPLEEGLGGLENPKDPLEEEAEEIAEFVESCFYDMSHSFSDFMSEIASMFQYGWDGHEIVYKERKGFDPKNTEKSSRFDDGKIGWKKFAHRSQNSLFEWGITEQGDLKSFKQQDFYRGDSDHGSTGGSTVKEIPIEKMLLFRTSSRYNNPEGRSLLRGSYRPWYFKKRIEEIEAIGIERDLAGMPVIHAPVDLFSENASSEMKSLFASLKNAVQNIRRDAQDGLIFPLEYDENGNKRYEFELASTGGRRQIDTNEIIRRRNMEMAMAVLSDFMMLGHENTGSFALSHDKTQMFSVSLDGFLMQVADVINRQAIPRLMRLNGMDLQLAPYVTFEKIQEPTLTEISEYIQRLARAGAPFFPDRRLQEWLHERAGFPIPIDPVEQAEEKEKAMVEEEPEGDINGLLEEEDAGFGNDGTAMTEGDGTKGGAPPAAKVSKPRGDSGFE